MLAREIGVLVVLTDDGPVRASYGARMLGAIARDRSRSPEAGEWVTAAPLVRRARDRRGRPDPALRPPALATVLPLRRNRPRTDPARTAPEHPDHGPEGRCGSAHHPRAMLQPWET